MSEHLKGLGTISDATIVVCTACGSELLAEPGTMLEHHDDGSHTVHPPTEAES
jgi:hypothetical protein